MKVYAISFSTLVYCLALGLISLGQRGTYEIILCTTILSCCLAWNYLCEGLIEFTRQQNSTEKSVFISWKNLPCNILQRAQFRWGILVLPCFFFPRVQLYTDSVELRTEYNVVDHVQSVLCSHSRGLVLMDLPQQEELQEWNLITESGSQSICTLER